MVQKINIINILKNIGNGLVITILMPVFIIMIIKECGGSSYSKTTPSVTTSTPEDYL